MLKTYYSILKYKIRMKLPWNFYKFISKIASSKREELYREQKKSYGVINPNINFFVIRKRPPGWGFFSNLFYVLQGLKYAEDNGYTPVVDMENYFMSELSALQPINGTRNAWNYFFDQVSDYQLSEVYKSRNVTLSDGNRISASTKWLMNRNTELVKSSEKMSEVSNLINKYINLNEPTTEYLENLKSKLSWVGDDTLGIFVRGSVYYNNIQFPINTIVDFELFTSEVNIFLAQNNFKNIYICTEDFRTYLKLCEIFSNYNILPSIRFDTKVSVEKWIKKQKITNIGGLANIGYYNTRTYLTEILLLSECNNFIGTFSNATVFAIAKSFFGGGNKSLILPDGTIKFKY